METTSLQHEKCIELPSLEAARVEAILVTREAVRLATLRGERIGVEDVSSLGPIADSGALRVVPVSSDNPDPLAEMRADLVHCGTHAPITTTIARSEVAHSPGTAMAVVGLLLGVAVSAGPE